MPRGVARPIGYEVIMKNGFVKVKTAEPDVWTLKHHIVAEQKLGRALQPGERVALLNSKETRGDPKPEDVLVVNIKPKTQRARKLTKDDRIEELEDQVVGLKTYIVSLEETLMLLDKNFEPAYADQVQ
jgi:hypothetical protein